MISPSMIKLTPEIEETTVTPSTSDQTIEVTPGIDGYGPINVEAVTSEIDSNIQPENIKRGVTILGTSGTYEAEAIQVDTLPTASVTEEGNIYQYVGTTDVNYTNGYFYKCVSDGAAEPTYSWININVQAQGDSLPSQSGQSGKFLTTDGTNASWATVNALQNKATTVNSVGIISKTNSSYYYSVAIGYNAKTNNNRTIVIGCEDTKSGGQGSILITTSWNAIYSPGESSVCVGHTSNQSTMSTKMVHFGNAGAIKYGWGSVFIGNQNENITLDAGSFYVGLMTSYEDYANSTFKLLSRDGTIPEARLADTTSATAGQVLTLDSNLNATWATPSGGGSVPTLTWYTVSTAGTTLTIADTSSAQLVKIYKNGLLLQPIEDYSISGTTLTTVSTLAVGDKITTEVF